MLISPSLDPSIKDFISGELMARTESSTQPHGPLFDFLIILYDEFLSSSCGLEVSIFP